MVRADFLSGRQPPCRSQLPRRTYWSLLDYLHFEADEPAGFRVKPSYHFRHERANDESLEVLGTGASRYFRKLMVWSELWRVRNNSFYGAIFA